MSKQSKGTSKSPRKATTHGAPGSGNVEVKVAVNYTDGKVAILLNQPVTQIVFDGESARGVGVQMVEFADQIAAQRKAK